MFNVIFWHSETFEYSIELASKEISRAEEERERKIMKEVFLLRGKLQVSLYNICLLYTSPSPRD